MKIEDWSNTTAITPDYRTHKIQANGNRYDLGVLAALGDNPDLSFLELLTEMSGQDPLATPAAPKSKEADKAGTEKKQGVPGTDTVAETQKTRQAEAARKSAEADRDNVISLKDLLDAKIGEKTLKLDELTDVDQDYIRRMMIPNLPILMGQVPADSVFPKGKDGGISYQGFEISDGLAEMIKHGYKTGQPIRLELDANSALVLRIRNGQVSAEFVAADQAAAMAMQNDLNELRQRMAARNLPVGTIESKYKDQPQQNQADQGQKQGTSSQNPYE